MPACPNCGRQTARTEDWACQWCGYPLRSDAFPVIKMTYSQVQAERAVGREPPGPMDAKVGREARRLEKIERHKAEKAALQHVKSQIEEARRQKQADEREARLVAMDEARRAAEEAEKKRLEDEAWEESLRMSQEQAERERLEAEERTAEEVKSEETAPVQAEAEDEAWEEAVRMSQEQAERERKEAEEREATTQATASAKEVTANAIEISADELSAAFNADNSAAHEKYTNSALKLSGKIARVVANEINNNYAVTLTGENAEEGFRDIRCKFGTEHADKVKGLNKGDKVTILGEYAGVVVDINLRDCKLV